MLSSDSSDMFPHHLDELGCFGLLGALLHLGVRIGSEGGVVLILKARIARSPALVVVHWFSKGEQGTWQRRVQVRVLRKGRSCVGVTVMHGLISVFWVALRGPSGEEFNVSVLSVRATIELHRGDDKV